MAIIQIDLKPHLMEYITMKYSWPVRAEIVEIPPYSELYVLMLDHLKRMPKPRSYYQNQGNTTFKLPNSNSGKRAATYCWLSPDGVSAIEAWIELMMWSDFHRYVEYQLHVRHAPLNLSIQWWMNMYDITQLSEDAFIKNYQRWRSKGRVNRLKK